MRAGHAGQALDLHDASDLAKTAALTGEVEALERHVLSVHRLKTAVPAAMLARTGALLGGGSDEQVARLGDFFEAIGLAFQITDDVLNLRGFEGNHKQRGEDLTNGKVTLPIVRAWGLLPKPERQWVWKTLRSRPTDPATIESVCRLLTDCGALESCCNSSREIVEDAWEKLDPVIEDSQVKLMFRAFGWFVLERHI